MHLQSSQTVHVTVDFYNLKLPECTRAKCNAKLRDLWAHADVSGIQPGKYKVLLDPHATAAYKVTLVQ